MTLFPVPIYPEKEQPLSDRKKSILLVEDDTITVLAEAAVLRKYGYDVITAESGEDALRVFKKEIKIDMVLMDIDLGAGMDGTGTAELILKDHDIPLVFLSSHTEKEIVDRTRSITNYGYILKNAGDTVLFASIDMAFKLHEANSRLRESESRYRLLADNSLDVIWNMDLTGMYTYISPSVYQLTGWTQEEAYRMKLNEYILPEYITAFMNLLAHELSLPPGERSTSKYLEFKQFKKDGSIIDVETNLAWIFDGNGNPAGIQGSSRDISSRKRMEETLHDSENRYRVIVENLDVVIYAMGSDGIVTFISPNVAKYGYRQEEILGHNLLEFIHPDDQKTVIESIPRVFENGEQFPLELRMIAKNGDNVWMLENGNIIRDETGAITQLVGFLWNVAELKRSEDALRKSEQQYRLLADNSTDVIWTMDLNGRFTYISPSVTKMTGWPQEEAMSMGLEDYVLPEDVEFIRKVIIDELAKPAAERAESKLIEIRQYAKDGSILYDEITATWIYNESGEIVGLQGSNRYINDRKLAEEALTKVLTEKEALLHELQHRVKNSMALINGLIGIESDRLKDPLAVEVLSNIKNRIQSMATLYDLLFQTNEVQETSLDIYLNQLSRILVDTYTTERKKINIEPQFESLRIDVKSAISIGLILNELMTNACKHAFGENNNGTVRIKLNRHNQDAILELEDNGSGLPRDFEMEKSTGMGLQIVKMLTNQLGGSITYHNKTGAFFRISIPLKQS